MHHLFSQRGNGGVADGTFVIAEELKTLGEQVKRVADALESKRPSAVSVEELEEEIRALKNANLALKRQKELLEDQHEHEDLCEEDLCEIGREECQHPGCSTLLVMCDGCNPPEPWLCLKHRTSEQ